MTLSKAHKSSRAASALSSTTTSSRTSRVVYESKKGAILGKGSGIKTAEQAKKVGAALRGHQTPD